MAQPNADEADALTAEVQRLRTAYTNLHGRSLHNRFLARAALIGLAMDLVLSAALGAVAFNAHQASDKAAHATSIATRNRQTQVASCRAGNDSREQNRQLWLFILDLSAQSNPHPTPAEQKVLATFRDRINAAFLQRDCSRIGPNGAPTIKPRKGPS